jgi:hypothetical protein
MAKNKKLEDKLALLLETMIDNMLTQAQSGEMSAQDFNNALKMLAQNGIDIEIKNGTVPAGVLTSLPFQSDSLIPESLLKKDKN